MFTWWLKCLSSPSLLMVWARQSNSWGWAVSGLRSRKFSSLKWNIPWQLFISPLSNLSWLIKYSGRRSICYEGPIREIMWREREITYVLGGGQDTGQTSPALTCTSPRPGEDIQTVTEISPDRSHLISSDLHSLSWCSTVSSQGIISPELLVSAVETSKSQPVSWPPLPVIFLQESSSHRQLTQS